MTTEKIKTEIVTGCRKSFTGTFVDSGTEKLTEKKKIPVDAPIGLYHSIGETFGSRLSKHNEATVPTITVHGDDSFFYVIIESATK